MLGSVVYIDPQLKAECSSGLLRFLYRERFLQRGCRLLDQVPQVPARGCIRHQEIFPGWGRRGSVCLGISWLRDGGGGGGSQALSRLPGLSASAGLGV